MTTQKHALRRFIIGAGLALLAACASKPPATPAQPASSLAGIEWKLTQIGNEPLPAHPAGERAPSIQFDQKSGASGYSGVNNFNGSYMSDNSRLSFGPVVMTRRAGPPAEMATESALIKVLGETRAYLVNGNTLELLDAAGKPLARFQATPPK